MAKLKGFYKPVIFDNIYDIVRRMAGVNPDGSSTKEKAGKLGDKGWFGLNDLRKHDSDSAAAMAAIYTQAVNTRRQFIRDFQEIRAFYLVDAILGLVSDDALTPDITTGEVVELSSKNPKINKLLQDLQRNINVDSLVHDIVPDLLSHGEYTVRQEVVKGKGLVQIHDDVDQSKIVAFYKRGLPSKFARMSKNDVRVYEPYHYAHFCLGKQKLRIKLQNEFSRDDSTAKPELPVDLPAYARVGKPLLYGVFGKIKELQLLESLIPATKLNDIMSGTLVGVSMPSGTGPKDAFEVVRRYEQLFNAKTGIDREGDQLSLRHILGVAGKIKAIPVFGDKGSLESLTDVKRNPSIDDLLSSVQDNRDVICTSIGIPTELLYGTDGEGKAAMLKKYARYLRCLKSLQTAVASGLKQICLTHVINSGISTVKLSDIEVRFRNEIISIDELEKLEFADAVVSMLGELHTFASDLQESTVLPEGAIDQEKFQSWLHSTLSLVIKDANFVKAPDADVQAPTPTNLPDLQRSQLTVTHEDLEDSNIEAFLAYEEEEDNKLLDSENKKEGAHVSE